LVRVAVADLSDAGLIDLVGQTDDPVLLNTASAEVARRLSEPETNKPLFTQEPNAEPNASTRYELEGRIDVDGEPEVSVEASTSKAA
jgi:hypothetical protein